MAGTGSFNFKTGRSGRFRNAYTSTEMTIVSELAKKSRPTPIWAAIAAQLRGDIREGRYGIGEKLPTEAQLSARFGVNRHTVRHGLAQLAEEGLVKARRGAGVFVTAQPTEYAIGKRVRFHANLLALGHRPQKRLTQIEQRAASAQEAQALELDKGEVICACHGVSLSDGLAIAVFESLFPLTRLPGIDQALVQTSSVTDALTRVGVSDYTRASTRLTAVLADATQALHLQIAEGAPLLRSSGINVDDRQCPVEYGRTWFAGDRVTLTLDG